MDKQGLGLSVEWIENATPEAKDEAQNFIKRFATLFDEGRMTSINEQFALPAVIDRITIKRIHA